jgi:hypothetical protein
MGACQGCSFEVFAFTNFLGKLEHELSAGNHKLFGVGTHHEKDFDDIRNFCLDFFEHFIRISGGKPCKIRRRLQESECHSNCKESKCH